MDEPNKEFRWLDPADGEESRKRQEDRDRRGEEYADEILSSLGGLASERESWVARVREPKLPIERYLPEVQGRLSNLWVVGAGNLSVENLRLISPELVQDASFQEDVVFHILRSRQDDIDKAFVRPFAVVKLGHFLRVGQAAKNGQMDLQKIQDNASSRAHDLLRPLVDNQELEDTLVASQFQRRLLRSLYYVLTEPDDSTARFIERLSREVEQDGPLSLKAMLGKTLNHIEAQHRKVSRTSRSAFETEENLILLLEEGRVGRLQELGRSVLVVGLGMKEADEYRGQE